MSKQAILADLESLAALEQLQAETAAAFQKLREQVIPVDVAEKLEEIAAEEVTSIGDLTERIRETKARISRMAEEHGETVKGSGKQAVVYVRRSVDLDKLQGYAVADPKVLEFIKEKVCVSIR